MLDSDRTARDPWYSERRWSRFAPLMGVLAVALWIIGVVIQETANTPDEETTREQLVRYFNEDDNTIIAAGFIFMLGSAIFLWFLSTLRERFAARERGLERLSSVVFASGIVIAAMSMAAFAPQVGGAFARRRTVGSTRRAARPTGTSATGSSSRRSRRSSSSISRRPSRSCAPGSCRPGSPG